MPDLMRLNSALPTMNPPPELVVMTIDDNLVLAQETLGREWARDPGSWPANDNADRAWRAFSATAYGRS